jgi:hypothetical protein
MPGSAQELTRQFTDLWWECDSGLPDLGRTYSPREQAGREKQLAQFQQGVDRELAKAPRSRTGAKALRERLGPAVRRLAQEALDFPAQDLQNLPSREFSNAAEDFVRKARAFDPGLSGEDIYQAGRNAWTANGLQWLMGSPVEITPSLLAYSLLYPYTDNYLDDAAVSGGTKRAFNERFRRRLEGEQIESADGRERIIFSLVAMIEGQFERSRHPDVFESLLAIHAAQGKSVHLMRPHAAPGEVDVMGLTFEKGGTSVLADGYLAAGSLNRAQREYAFGQGILAQLLDDLEDIPEDLRDGRLTVYSQAAGRWPLDSLTRRTFHFGRKVLDRLECFGTADPVKEMIQRGAVLLLIDAVRRAGRFHSQPFLGELEAHSPFRFSFLARHRKDFIRRHGSLARLMETQLLE